MKKIQSLLRAASQHPGFRAVRAATATTLEVCRQSLAFTLSMMLLVGQPFFLTTRAYAQTAADPAPTPPPAYSPTLNTDKGDYSPTTWVQLTGTGFKPNEIVTFQVVHIVGIDEDQDSGDLPWEVQADANGNVSTTWYVPWDAYLDTLLATAYGNESKALASAIFTDGAPNGIMGWANTDAKWQSANSTHSSWREGDTVPLRWVQTGMTVDGTTTHTLILKYDYTNSSKSTVHFFDYLASYNATTGPDPTSGVPNPGTASTIAIPADSGLPFAHPPGNLTVYNATNVTFNGYSSDSTGTIRMLSISFKAAGSGNVIIAYGGHLGSPADWGAGNGAHYNPGSSGKAYTNIDGASSDDNWGLSVGEVAITKVTPVINWSNPLDITYGAALSGTQLNATATYLGNPVAGTFVYSPTSGTILNAGNGQNLTVTFTPTDTTNYNTPAPKTVQINVLPRPLTVTATAQNKIYDGTTSATVTLADNRLTGDVFTVSYSSAAFADKNVGAGKTVTVSGISLSGTSANNYAPNTTATTTANITPKDVIGGFTVPASKPYDGNTSATVLTRTLTGVISSDSVALSGGIANYNSATVGTGKLVTLTGATLGGTAAGNYNLASVNTTTAAILSQALTGTFTASNKVYDGTTAAIVASYGLVGAIPGDDVSLTGGTATFADKNVGSGKTVTLTGATLTGADAGKYTLGSISTATANITAKHITGSFDSSDKVYDGNTSAAATNRSLTGAVASDNVSLTGGTASFADKNVGSGKTVTLTGATLTGTDAGNYALDSVATPTAAITAKHITGAFDSANKSYDGNTSAASTNRRLSGVLGTDDVSLSGGTASFADANVGTNKTVTLSGASLTGAGAGNYFLDNVATTTADITLGKATGTLHGVTLAGGEDFGGTGNTLYLTSLVGQQVTLRARVVGTPGGAVPTGTVTFWQFGSTASFNAYKVGTGNPGTLAGAELTAATTAANNYAAVPWTAAQAHAYKVANAVNLNKYAAEAFTGAVSPAVALAGGGTATPVTITLDANGVGDFGPLPYSVTTGSYTYPVLVAGDHLLAFEYSGDSKYAAFDPDMAWGILGAQTSTALAVSDGNPTYGGSVTWTATATTGNPYFNNPSTPAGRYGVIEGSIQFYLDNNLVSTVSVPAYVAGNSTLNGYNGVATYTASNLSAGAHTVVAKYIDGGAFVNTSTPPSPGAAYYDSTSDSVGTSVGQKHLTGAFDSANKTYDGNTSAAATNRRLTGISGSDDVSLTGGTASFANKNVGTDKSVTLSGATLTGAKAANYVLDSVAPTKADITALHITGGFDSADKTYDGTTSATATNRRLTGNVTSDNVSLTGGTASFADKNVGTNKTVTLSGATLTGTDAGNYILDSVAIAKAAITGLHITGGFASANKTYDGTTSAPATNRNLTGVLSGDTVSLTGGTASFANKNAGTGKTVTLSGASLTGSDAGNYVLDNVATTTADIGVLHITGAFDSANKTYDGTTSAAANNRRLSGNVTSDNVSLTGGTATFADKNIGTNKTVTLSGATLTGTDAGNYFLDNVATTKADIGAKHITGAFDSANKLYDGSTSAAATNRRLTGNVPTDDVSLIGGTASFANKNVGTNKPVTLSGATLTGNDAGNYVLDGVATTTANITGLHITGAFASANKVYDGTTSAAATNRSLTGVLSGDTVSLTGGTATFADKNAGTNKTVTLSGATLTGTDSGNYILDGVATTTADITIKHINGAFDSANKVYDGTTAAASTNRRLTGTAASDSISLTGGTATFADANVGSGKTVSLSGASLTGTDAANYILDNVALALANISKAASATVITMDAGGSDYTVDCKPHGADKATVTGAGGLNIDSYLYTDNSTTPPTIYSIVYTGTTNVGTPTQAAYGPTGVKPTLNGSYTATATYPGDANHTGSSDTESFTISGIAGPGAVGGSLYTGSLFFWTTGPSSSTASLALSCTVADIADCKGDIRGATVTFQASNDGTTWKNISNAVNLKVGLTDPNNRSIGTASALSQWTMQANNDVEQFMIRIIIGGTYHSDVFTYPVTVAKPGLASQFIGCATVNNGALTGGYPQSSGYLGNNVSTDCNNNTDVAANVKYNKSGTNPQGKVIVMIHTYNKPDGSNDYPNLHHYVATSNAISELSLQPAKQGQTAISFSSKITLKEMFANGSTASVDSGNMMNITLVPGTTKLMSVQIQKSQGVGGGLWYSSSWGPASLGALPSTLPKPIASGDIVSF